MRKEGFSVTDEAVDDVVEYVQGIRPNIAQFLQQLLQVFFVGLTIVLPIPFGCSSYQCSRHLRHMLATQTNFSWLWRVYIRPDTSCYQSSVYRPKFASSQNSKAVPVSFS